MPRSTAFGRDPGHTGDSKEPGRPPRKDDRRRRQCNMPLWVTSVSSESLGTALPATVIVTPVARATRAAAIPAPFTPVVTAALAVTAPVTSATLAVFTPVVSAMLAVFA